MIKNNHEQPEDWVSVNQFTLEPSKGSVSVGPSHTVEMKDTLIEMYKLQGNNRVPIGKPTTR